VYLIQLARDMVQWIFVFHKNGEFLDLLSKNQILNMDTAPGRTLTKVIYTTFKLVLSSRETEIKSNL
jgi:hypothetical protein